MNYGVLKLSGEDSAIKKQQIVEAFGKLENRVLIVNMLAGGVGLNLQCCANTLVLERQWSAADEEQFESRFHRNGQKKAVVAEYMGATGTIDQWFHELVEEKRQIFGETIQGWELISDRTSLKDLAIKTVNNPWK
jgi:SNF2 family DNA or RNA helicase